MAAQIMIELVPDDTKLKSTLDKLEAGGGLSADQTAAFKAGNAELEKQNKLLEQNARNVTQVSDAEKKLLPTLKDVTKATGDMADAVIKVSASEFQKMMKETGMTAEQLIQHLGGATQATKQFGEAEKKAGDEQRKNEPTKNKDLQLTQSLTAEKKKLRTEMAQLILEGKTETKMFQDLAARAGEIDDAMKDANDAISRTGSDTRGLDNALLAARGLAAGFTAATSLMAIFGGESEKVQQMLLKVNAAMALLNSLQEVQNILKSEYVKTLIASITATKASTTATVAEGAAIEGAAAAQTQFNLAAAANPYLAIVAVLLAVVAALQAYAMEAEGAAEAQMKFNDTIEGADLDSYLQDLDRATELQKALAKLNGATAEEILKLEKVSITAAMRMTQAKMDEIQATMAAGGLTLQQRQDAIAALQERTNQLKSLVQQYQLNGVAIKQAQKDASEELADEQKRADEKAQAANKAHLDKLQQQRDQALEAAKAAIKATEDELFAITHTAEETEVRAVEQKYAERKTILEKAGQDTKILVTAQEAELAAIRKKYLDKAAKEAEEQRDAEYDADVEIDEAMTQMAKDYYAELDRLEEDDLKKKKKKNDEEVALRKQLANAAIAIAAEISNAIFEVDAQRREQELNAQLDALEKSKERALQTKNLTEAQKAQIQQKYDKEEARIKTEAAKKERKAQSQQALVNTLLAVTSALATVQPTVPAGIIAAALALAMGMIQVAKINSAPLPQYATGVQNAPPGLAWVGEEGPELIQMKGGENVYTAFQSDRLMRDWDAGKRTRQYAYNQREFGEYIDYEELGKAVARNMPAAPNVSMVADERGLTLYLDRQHSRQIIRNKRYSLQ